MKLTITRNKDPLSFGQGVRIFLNGAPTIQLIEGQKVEMVLHLPEQSSVILSVKEIKRTSLQIKDGDHILLERNPIYLFLAVSGIFLLVSSFLFHFPSSYAFPLLISSFLVEQFKLKKIPAL